MEDDRLVLGERLGLGGDALELDVARALDVAGLALVRLADVDQLDLTGPDRDAFLEMVHSSRELHRPWAYPPERPDQFDELLSRLTDFKVADESGIAVLPNILLRGVTRLPITFGKLA